MKTPACNLLVSLAFALPAVAQTTMAPARPSSDTEKLWKIEATGISG